MAFDLNRAISGRGDEVMWHRHIPATVCDQRRQKAAVKAGLVEPCLEIVEANKNEAFRAWSHGYPHRTVRWHYHPEYEIHLVTDTVGHYFVGDYIGTFAPGNLVITGPGLPHNWVSNVMPGVRIARRCIVLQFSQDFVTQLVRTFPELRGTAAMFSESLRGVLFSKSTAEAATRIMAGLLEETGAGRVRLFMELLETLTQDRERVTLSSATWTQSPDSRLSNGMNAVLTNLRTSFAQDLSEAEFARSSGQSPSAFSRAFRRSTGMPFVQYLNQLRISAACQMLIGSRLKITDICFQVGFNNVSNFNRRFAALKGMSPMQFRRCFLAGLSNEMPRTGEAGSACTWDLAADDPPHIAPD